MSSRIIKLQIKSTLYLLSFPYSKLLSSHADFLGEKAHYHYHHYRSIPSTSSLITSFYFSHLFHVNNAHPLPPPHPHPPQVPIESASCSPTHTRVRSWGCKTVWAALASLKYWLPLRVPPGNQPFLSGLAEGKREGNTVCGGKEWEGRESLETVRAGMGRERDHGNCGGRDEKEEIMRFWTEWERGRREIVGKKKRKKKWTIWIPSVNDTTVSDFLHVKSGN